MLNNQIPSTPVLIEDLGMKYPNENSKQKRRFGIYKCECGELFTAQTYSIKIGNTNSCGCFQKNKTSIHGLSHHRIYKTWNGMIDRTINKKNISYNNYGGRGIIVCERWHNVAFFIEDMYPTYQEGLSIDRIDNNGNYEPSNCRWATKTMQSRNTRILTVRNTSGYRGVTWNKNAKRFMSRIILNKKYIHLGNFLNVKDAAIAYDNYVIENNLEHTINGVS